MTSFENPMNSHGSEFQRNSLQSALALTGMNVP
jgi:hypothetical protein